MSYNDFLLKRVDYVSADVQFCKKHWDWAMAHGKQIFIVEYNNKIFSIAVSSDSRTICADESHSIISYKEPLTLDIGIPLINFLEEERILSSMYVNRQFHEKVLNKLCKIPLVDSSLCTCGAVKTYGISCLRQSFMHSDWCNVHK